MESFYGVTLLFVSFVAAPVPSCADTLDTQKVLSILAEQRDEILQLKETVSRVANENALLKKDNRELRSEFHHLKNANMSPRHKRLLLETPQGYCENQKVAFTARLSKHMSNLGNNQPIVFDNIVTNIGHHYSSNTGVFTAPINATYYFFASIMSHSGQVLESEIVKNGARMVLMYSYDKAHEQGTNSVVLHLGAGDEVWTRHTSTVGTMVYGNNWSTFSGFQLSDC